MMMSLFVASNISFFLFLIWFFFSYRFFLHKLTLNKKTPKNYKQTFSAAQPLWCVYRCEQNTGTFQETSEPRSRFLFLVSRSAWKQTEWIIRHRVDYHTVKCSADSLVDSGADRRVSQNTKRWTPPLLLSVPHERKHTFSWQTFPSVLFIYELEKISAGRLTWITL